MHVTPSQQRPRVKVYQPTAGGVPPIGPYVGQLLERRPLIWHLARSGLKADHYNTFLGQVWIILDPLLLAGVYYLVRVVLRPAGTGDERFDLIAHLIVGVFVFQFISQALNKGSRALLSNKAVILNSSFPRGVFAVVAVVDGVLEFLPRLAVYLVLHVIFGQPVTGALVFLPLILGLMVVLTFGLVLIFSPLAVRYQDTKRFLPYFTRLWLFASPVLWTVAEMPKNVSFLKANPLFPYFAAMEQVLNGDLPAVQYLAAAAVYSIAALAVGTVVFLKLERDVASHL